MTARRASAARRTCRAAGPTAATAATAATSRRCDARCATCSSSAGAPRFRAGARRRRRRLAAPRRQRRAAGRARAAGHAGARRGRRVHDLVRSGPARGRRARRRGRPRQQAVRDADAPGARASHSAVWPGEERWLELELRLLADVGLVGLPNAGKSSLLARLTRAAPKIADYPFTTLEPVLGTLEVGERQLVIADIPGLIEGASDGAGLGHEFLAHVERTRLLVHVLDLAPLDGSDPIANHATIEEELARHDARLAALPRVLALSKADLVEPARPSASPPPGGSGSTRRCSSPRASRARASRSSRGSSTIACRSSSRRPPLADPSELAEHRTFRPAPARGFRVERTEDGIYRVERRGHRAPARAPRPRQRRGARAHRIAPAATGRDPRAGRAGVHGRRRRRDRAASPSSSTSEAPRRGSLRDQARLGGRRDRRRRAARGAARARSATPSRRRAAAATRS